MDARPDAGGADARVEEAGPNHDASAPGDGAVGCDTDGDGHDSFECGGDDCDDGDSTRFPGNPELCDAAGHDEDCDDATIGLDADGDGHVAAGCCGSSSCGDDCDDADASIHPGAAELCDRLDNDCSSGGGLVPGEDADGDGHAPIDGACTGGPLPADDCDDSDPTIPADVPPPVALLAPDNGATTGRSGLRPTFRWHAVRGCAVTYELEIDDSCAAGDVGSCAFDSPELVVRDLTSTSAAPDMPLPVSSTAPVGRRYFWRVRACERGICHAWSEARYLEVGRARNDVDGDGYSDVVVGSIAARAFVYFGSDSVAGPLRSVTLVGSESEFGQAVAIVGDVNADGFADVAVGASFPMRRSYLYLGGATGVGATSSVIRPDAGGELARAGDVNADGFADVVVGDRNYSSARGVAFVLLGGGSGLVDAAPFSFSTPDIEYVGASVASGDFDADGFADVLVGTARFENSYVLRGSATGPSTTAVTRLRFAGDIVAHAGDVNGDGYADAMISGAGWDRTHLYLGGATGLGPSADMSIVAPDDETFGRPAVGVGDTNGDGWSDVLVRSAGDGGRAFLHLGLPTGLDPTPAVILESPSGGLFAASLAPAGDFDGDGYDDAVVGAQDARRVYLYRGGPTGLDATPAVTMSEPEVTRFGVSVGGS